MSRTRLLLRPMGMTPQTHDDRSRWLALYVLCLGMLMIVLDVTIVNVALPRVRDFRGVSPKGFDGRGNYTLGLRDQLLFPEIDYMKVDKARGMNVSVVTTAKTDQEARKLLQFVGMPFRQAGQS